MSAASIRARLDHPVVDADGHLIEFIPLIRDYVVELGGAALGARFDVLVESSRLTRGLDANERRAYGLSRTGWWGLPARNTLDRATATLPGLLYERLDELGIDFAVLYPTLGLAAMAIDDDELRRALARACNRYYAEQYRDFADRLGPVGIVPTYTPEEAIAELDYATSELGLKAFLFGGLVLRPAPGHDGDRTARWVDGLGLDSAYDYDPLWQRCVDVGVSPTFHSTGIGFGSRTSPTNYVANHIGNFAAGSEAVCRSLLFGGVPRRFPSLHFAFLEGGAAWAATLFADVVGHWEKRNRDAIAHYDPRALDRARLEELFRSHGPDAFVARLDRLADSLLFLSDPDEDPDTLDEFARSGITSVDDVVDVFGRQFHIGCEADDPMNALAFDRRVLPMRTRLQAMFASDIGHWDVPDFRGVLPEAWELVEDGLIDEGDFRAFTLEHAVSLWGSTNPMFFAGTVVEHEAERFLRGS
jgi:predicted TIM-barrel fold metal-dependent hydrolase